MLLSPVNFQKFSKNPQQLLPKATENPNGTENIKQKIVWSMTLISKYKYNLNTNDSNTILKNTCFLALFKATILQDVQLLL